MQGKHAGEVGGCRGQRARCMHAGILARVLMVPVVCSLLIMVRLETTCATTLVASPYPACPASLPTTDCQAAHHPLCVLCGELLPGAHLQPGGGLLHRAGYLRCGGCRRWVLAIPLSCMSCLCADCPACLHAVHSGMHLHCCHSVPAPLVVAVTVQDLQLDISLGGMLLAAVSVVSFGLQQIFVRIMQQKHKLSAHELLSNTAPAQVGLSGASARGMLPRAGEARGRHSHRLRFIIALTVTRCCCRRGH